ncbi:MAG: glycoside hydrolase family 88 protein [Fimbriimonadaceae bacterium]|nr:glycoside hydrolase family 88 protein [Fimbriimonadaceae bacterium]
MTPVAVDRSALRQRLEMALAFAQQQVRGLVERDPDYYPMYTVNGQWRHGGERWTNWCEGFLPGMMWVFAKRSGDAWWRQTAERYTVALDSRQHDRHVHDLNFVLGSSYGRWYDLTGDPALQQVLITAGETMGLRFKEAGGYLRSFVSDDSLFIDIMMNVGILFRSAAASGNAELRRRADTHCATSRRYLVRGDGSTAHEAMFDLTTGECLRQTTHQGYRGDSCWVRGLAWSLYGFASSYGYTGNPDYLETSRQNATCLLRGLPDDGVSPYDFDAPAEARPIDTSGSAIGAAGLLKLASVVGDAAAAAEYRAAAFQILGALCEPAWLAHQTPGWEGILKAQVYHLHKQLGVGESCMFGDHFFVEAVDAALTLLEA